MYRILHTADWHLGRKFLGKSCEDEEVMFINYFLNFIEQNEINLILLSGDVFDCTNPPIYAEKNYFYFLKKIKKINCKLIITSGNHDSKRKLEASYQLFKDNENITVCTKPELIKINSELLISAIPFLTLEDLNIDINGKTYIEIEKEYKEKTKNIYVEYSKNDKKYLNIAMGHFSISGFSVDSTNRRVKVTDYAVLSKQDVDKFSYLAMGHLHKRQNIDNVVYSGSPFVCTFGEAENERSMAILNVEDKTINWEFVDIPTFRDVKVFKGDLRDIIDKISLYENNAELDCYASIVLENEISEVENKELKILCEKNKINLLKIILKNNNFEKTEIVNFTIEQNPKEIFSAIVDNSDPDEYVKYKDKMLNYFEQICDWSIE